MRKRILKLGAAAVLLAGICLGIFFKGFGLGPGNGTGATGDGAGSGLRQEAPANSRDETLVGLPAGGMNAHPAQPDLGTPRDMLMIVISGDGYRLVDSETSSAPGTPITLEQIRQQLGSAKGNAGGIRVRVLKSRSAQEGARSDLLSALLGAGVKREEIQERADFID